MKIIKPPPPWSYTFTCKACKAELEAEASDVRLGSFGGVAYAGESGEWKHYVICSNCHTDHIISDSKIPKDVQNKAKRDP